jgi:hypothetical protein
MSSIRHLLKAASPLWVIVLVVLALGASGASAQPC